MEIATPDGSVTLLAVIVLLSWSVSELVRCRGGGDWNALTIQTAVFIILFFLHAVGCGMQTAVPKYTVQEFYFR